MPLEGAFHIEGADVDEVSWPSCLHAHATFAEVAPATYGGTRRERVRDAAEGEVRYGQSIRRSE